MSNTIKMVVMATVMGCDPFDEWSSAKIAEADFFKRNLVRMVEWVALGPGAR